MAESENNEYGTVAYLTGATCHMAPLGARCHMFAF